MYSSLHGRFSLAAAFLITLLTVFSAHATDCNSIGDHAVTAGRASDRSNQIVLGDAADLLPTIAAASYWSGDCRAPSPDVAAVQAPTLSPAPGAAACESKTAGEFGEISNTALEHKTVTVLLI